MTRDEIIRDLEERAVGEDCRYIALRCDVAREIVRIMRDQEPRVMTREEVLATPEGVVVWMEEEAESGTYIQPIVSTGNGCLGNFYLGVVVFGVEYSSRRFWTSRPTEEQRKAVLWDGERL